MDEKTKKFLEEKFKEISSQISNHFSKIDKKIDFLVGAKVEDKKNNSKIGSMTQEEFSEFIRSVVGKTLNNHLSEKQIDNIPFRMEQLELRQIYLQRELLKTPALENLKQFIYDKANEFGVVDIDSLVEFFPSIKYSRWRRRVNAFIEPEIRLITGSGGEKSFFVIVGDPASAKAIAVDLFLKAKKNQEVSVRHYEPLEFRREILFWVEKLFKKRIYPQIDFVLFKFKKKY
jgi:hypothetical protein